MSYRFRTDFIPCPILPKIKPSSNILMLGSCFSDHIGRKLNESKFQVQANPLGNIFNPISLAKIIKQYLLANRKIQADELWYRNGVYAHKDFHSIHNRADPLSYITDIQLILDQTQKHLKESSHIILTFGTSWGYREKRSKLVVSNCHKMDPFLFEKELFSVEKMNQLLTPILENIEASIILTVSPVRHLKDGFVENTRSKARLIEMCHVLADTNSNCTYFPSFELMMDDLRDYRFYTEDMIHPSSVAIEYIWSKFKGAVFSGEAMIFANNNEKILKAKRHRPFLTESVAFRQFCLQQLKKLSELKQEYPFIDYQKETDYFTQFLK